MSRPSRLSYDEMSDALDVFVTDSRAKYGDYGYAAGYLTTALAQALTLLPRHQQLLVIESLKHSSVYK
jgi:hypothetical protein